MLDGRTDRYNILLMWIVRLKYMSCDLQSTCIMFADIYDNKTRTLMNDTCFPAEAIYPGNNREPRVQQDVQVVYVNPSPSYISSPENSFKNRWWPAAGMPLSVWYRIRSFVAISGKNSDHCIHQVGRGPF